MACVLSDRRRSQKRSSTSAIISIFFFNDTSPTEIYTLSLHDALPISRRATSRIWIPRGHPMAPGSPSCPPATRSEEHTSELQSQFHLVCRLLLEKKKNKQTPAQIDCLLPIIESGHMVRPLRHLMLTLC